MRYALVFVLFVFSGFSIADVPLRIGIQDLNSTDFLVSTYKLKKRKACHRSVEPIQGPRLYSAPDEYNAVAGFLKRGLEVTTLAEIESAGLMQASLREVPWSGDYWPYSFGLLANRFLDTQFYEQPSWLDRYEYVQKYPAIDVIVLDSENLNSQLSVAEKYDYLVDDFEFPLTENMWARGKAIHEETGEVDDWMGLCHGWAASSIVMSQPRKTVSMRSFDNKNDVQFFPDEIKALSSFSWAEARYPTHFTGRRCNEEGEDADDREKHPECQDMNPATFHQILVHQIGLYKESFVVDATYDLEVWNHPVYEYEYQYFNPKSRALVKSLKKATVSLAEMGDADPFAEHRNPVATSIVGIELTLGIVIETDASKSEEEVDLEDRTQHATYYYDLELDSRGNIVGGEWYHSDHPDFIWKPALGATDLNGFDNYVDPRTLSQEAPLDDRWKYVVSKAAGAGFIVPSLVHFLIGRSKEKDLSEVSSRK